jgi:arylsulfatase A-like enzyme
MKTALPVNGLVWQSVRQLAGRIFWNQDPRLWSRHGRSLRLLFSALQLGLLATLQAAAASPPKPNIIVVPADELGYPDLGCQGSNDLVTPSIDSLARNGVRCTEAYLTAPLCAPSRAGLLTGRYQARFGHDFNPGPAKEFSGDYGLSREELTLAERLGRLGYATGMVGKWHLGTDHGFRPTDRGFAEFFGFLSGGHSYFAPTVDRVEPRASANAILGNAQPVDEKEYLRRFAQVKSPTRQPRDRVAAMAAVMAEGVGAILAKLRQHRLEERTLIFFLSDNGGGWSAWGDTHNGPLRGTKGHFHEGGIRIPFLLQWKARLPAGTVYRDMVSSLDIAATALAAASHDQAERSTLDGVDLVPFLSGDRQEPPHPTLYWRRGAAGAMRSGPWKLVIRGPKLTELYHLGEDLGEAKNLAAHQPDKLRELEARWRDWNSGMAPPHRWDGSR